VTCLISTPSKPFISFRVCLCVCVGVIRNHLVIPLFFFHRIFTQISFCCRFSLLFKCCWNSIVGCIVYKYPASRETLNAV
jgi:hypothetical protein